MPGQFRTHRGDVAGLMQLVASAHPVDSPDYDGSTPLHLAAVAGKLEAVYFLLSQGTVCL